MAFENFLHAFDHAFRVDPVHDKKHARKEVIASVRAQRNTRASACDAWTKKTMYVSIHERERERKSVAFVKKAQQEKKTFVLFHKTNKQGGFSFCVLPKKKKIFPPHLCALNSFMISKNSSYVCFLSFRRSFKCRK